MTNLDVDYDQVYVRTVEAGELEQHVSRTKYMLVATVVASMSIIAVAALFMSLFF
jgi:hypothetical protein